MLSGFAGLVEVLRSRAENAFYAPVLSVSAAGGKPSNPELVFVIHGRQLLGEFHIFLRALGLKPLEWSEARKRTGNPNPYTWEIVDLALKQAGAIVAFFTPDDEARLREPLWTSNESALEKQYLSQPRQNVLFEAGVAYGRDPQRTVLIRVGSHRPMSDLTGHHILALDDSPQSRQAVADVLRLAGSPVDVSDPIGINPEPSPSSSHWRVAAPKRIEINGIQPGCNFSKTQIRGFSELHDAANIVTSIHSFFSSEPEYLNDANTKFLEKYPLNFKERLSFDAAESMKQWSIKDLLEDVDTLNIG